MVFILFFPSYYGEMIVTSCGYLYIIFSLMRGLGANFRFLDAIYFECSVTRFVFLI